ncbi:uncharacterized protein LOC126782248 isoform X2 [Argentina anserina]|uniref:uncharacterized protein LOC126782248 isoform X2 n=1 Tax=Argentina anserina TaxID=57926 RepID=UPI0021766D94|nr:uncharacterized protein LOC126782248 isoform X2 [Potentilla anserina]
MGEILFSCAGNRRAVIATLSVIGDDVARFEGSKDVLIAKSIESATDLHKGLRVKTYKTKESAFQGLEAVIYVFRSRMEALLFLISALLSRGLADRDDPTLPLVTASFDPVVGYLIHLWFILMNFVI